MIRSLLAGSFMLVALTSQTCNSDSHGVVVSDPALPKKGFAVVELFTSEGCSSCPPADKLVTEIARKAEQDSVDILILSEHVDYWNKIGWVDPFSSAFYSERQSWYAEHFRDEGVYTPQIVVNGTSAFVGSNKQQATKSINSALKATELSQQIEISRNDANTNCFHYKLDRPRSGYILNVVLVEKHAVSTVTRGENEGRVLSHTNIVRDWMSMEDPAVAGNIAFKKMQAFDKDKFRVIAFVQNKESREIVSAGIL